MIGWQRILWSSLRERNRIRFATTRKRNWKRNVQMSMEQQQRRGQTQKLRCHCHIRRRENWHEYYHHIRNCNGNRFTFNRNGNRQQILPRQSKKNNQFTLFNIFKIELLFIKKNELEKLLNGDPDRIDPDKPMECQTEFLPYDKEWEFPRKRLRLGLFLTSS